MRSRGGRDRPAGAEVDWVVINGLLNLTLDKTAVLREVARSLKPGCHRRVDETRNAAGKPGWGSGGQ